MTIDQFLGHKRADDIATICKRVFLTYIATAVALPIMLLLFKAGVGFSLKGLTAASVVIFLFLVGGVYTGAFVFFPISLLWYMISLATGENLLFSLVFGAATALGLGFIASSGAQPDQATMLAVSSIGALGGLIYWLLACRKIQQPTRNT